MPSCCESNNLQTGQVTGEGKDNDYRITPIKRIFGFINRVDMMARDSSAHVSSVSTSSERFIDKNNATPHRRSTTVKLTSLSMGEKKALPSCSLSNLLNNIEKN